MAKFNKKGRAKRKLDNFVALEHYLLDSPAWRSLDPVSRAAYVELARSYNGTNNGRLLMSARMLADRLGISKDTAARKLHALRESGFIELVKQSGFNMKMRHCAEYRLTSQTCDATGALPSKAFMRWQPNVQKTVRCRGRHGQIVGTEGKKTTRETTFGSPPSD